tara:strand:+ start:14 stop:835 length:822 start_codon:yes stop_codon:yes gene_type:complete
MAQQTFAGVPSEFTAGEVLSSSDQNLLRNFLIALIKEGQTGDTGEILPMIMDLTNNRVVLDSGGLEFSNGSTQTIAAAAGMTWSGSTANGLGTYGSGSSIVAESTATYDGATLALTGSGGGLKLDELNSTDVNTLDSYEEGTWDMGIECSTSGSITLNGSYDYGYYVKIGKLVWVGAYGIVSSVSSPVGQARINGLPFTSISGGAQKYAMSGIMVFRAESDIRYATTWADPGTTKLRMSGSYNDGDVTYDANSAAWFGGNEDFSFNMCYLAAT